MVDDFELNSNDKASGLWLRLKIHLEHRLAAARLRNDDPMLSADATAKIRGEIACLKALMRLDADRPLM